MNYRIICSLGIGVWCGVAGAAQLTSARVTEIRNDVRYQTAEAAERAAQVMDVIRESDVLRTGERSLAELEFDDKTITRLGSLSVFSFNRETREFHAGKGTMLVCVPKGKGGGRIVTSAITAAIQGTTVVTQERDVTSGDGRLHRESRVIFLEGNGVVYRTGDSPRNGAPIGAGQMITQFADSRGLAHVQHVDIGALTARSRIIHGFTAPLPSLPIIQTVVSQQQTEMQHGDLQRVSTTPTTGSGTGGTTPGGTTSGDNPGGTTGTGGATITTGGGDTTGGTTTTTGGGTTITSGDTTGGGAPASSPAAPPTPAAHTGGTGVPDAPQSQSASRPVIYSVGGGFYLSTLPIPGMNSAPLEGGGYVCRPKQ